MISFNGVMGQAVIIEDIPENIKDFKEIMEKVNSDVKVIAYSDLKSFHEDFLKANQIGSEEDEETDLHLPDLELIIADLELTKTIPIDLWKKILDSINDVKKKNERVRFLLTTYDDFDLDEEIFSYTDLMIFNLLIKPFDRTTTEQYLDLALDDKDSFDISDVYSHESEDQVEMIKRVNIELLTELGFRCQSDRPIPVGNVARYYSSVFGTKELNSVFAYCYANYEISENSYVSSFSFTGIDHEQLNEIRVKIRKSEDKIVHQFKEEEAQPAIFAMCFRSASLKEKVKILLNEKFDNINFINARIWDEIVSDEDDPQVETQVRLDASEILESEETVLAVFTDDSHLNLDLHPIMEENELTEVKVFLFSESAVAHYENYHLFNFYSDVFHLPLDRYYITRKMKMFYPFLGLKNEEDNSRAGLPVNEEIKVGLPIHLKSISEVHLSVIYKRELSPGDVRHFNLWMPNFDDLPEILAVCRRSESHGGNEFLCHFLFFGVSDKHTRHIRKWILKDYQESKNEEES